MNLWLNLILFIIYFFSLYFAVFWILTFLEHPRESRGRRLKRFPLVSIAVPAYNEEHTISKTIKSVLSLDYPAEKIQLIVVDDGSTDGTANIIKELQDRYPRIHLLSQNNMGKSSALNNALKIARGEFFICLDADSTVERYTLKRMLAFYYAQNDNRLAVVTPTLKIYRPKTMLHKFQHVEYLAGILLQRLMSFLDCMYVAPGPFSIYRTDILIKVGGFNESTVTEDQEIAYRMQSLNYKLKQCPASVVYTTPLDALPLYRQRRRWYWGSLQNIVKYRRIIFNRSYGDFGMFQMPLNLSMFVMGGASVIFFAYLTLSPMFKSLYNMFLVHFDMLPYIKTFEFNISLFSFDAAPTIILAMLFLTAIIIFVLSHRISDEKLTSHGLFYIPLYFFYYYLFLSVIAIWVAFRMLAGKRHMRW